MKKFNNKSGFTLIEIIVVLIIVGILAAIALPNLFSNVSKSRAEEALASVATYRPTMEGCIVKEAGTTDQNCNAVNLGFPASTANFSYSVGAPSGATDTNYVITATGTGALSGTDEIVISRGVVGTPSVWPATGAVNCVGVGKLLGAC